MQLALIIHAHLGGASDGETPCRLSRFLGLLVVSVDLFQQALPSLLPLLRGEMTQVHGQQLGIQLQAASLAILFTTTAINIDVNIGDTPPYSSGFTKEGGAGCTLLPVGFRWESDHMYGRSDPEPRAHNMAGGSCETGSELTAAIIGETYPFILC